ncbi:YjcZ family sporulation protein [Evansella sp. AB-P1]|nr:YjcZ family sporulation protein [Evansella sp. AB-P1]MDG5789101.1 YjcZ family sporulation protein [Evansella sp. AB-P1]
MVEVREINFPTTTKKKEAEKMAYASGFALVLVLFILLVIIGTAVVKY